MTRRDIVTGLAAGTAFLVVSGCEMFPARFRFKMTIEVNTPSGLRFGSSVMEASAAEETIWIGNDKVVKLRGEAVAVDLPAHQTMFVLLNEMLPRRVAELFISDLSSEAKPFVAGFATLGTLAMRGQTRELPSSQYPEFVRFLDISDPKSIEKVDPQDLSTPFGEGVKLKNILVQITDDPVTISIGKRFPWWREYYDRGLRMSGRSDAMFSGALNDNVGTGSFSLGGGNG